MFKGNEGEKITLQEAEKFTENYRKSEKAEAIKAEFIGKELVNEILSQEKCVGLRLYFGKNEKGNLNIVVVGANKDGNDLYNGVIADKLPPCPPYCGTDSPLLG
ncbi:MAG: hypothetical protein GWP19_05285 [Planctomycetia bacterium]|nr:hypothetical protein [Planctomycetia bacterium]